MKEMTGDLFDQDGVTICITTNGIVRESGEAVMGKGCALEARKRCKGIERVLGDKIRINGNHVFYLGSYNIGPVKMVGVVSFPTKRHYKNPSSLELIKESAIELVNYTNLMEWKKVIIPRPGCGSGNLNWGVVKNLLSPILDDRFYIITNE